MLLKRLVLEIHKISGAGSLFRRTTGNPTFFPVSLVSSSSVTGTGTRHFFSKPIHNSIITASVGVGFTETGLKAKMHSEKSVVDFHNLRIISIPASADNFMYLIVEKASQTAFAVDPLEPESILEEVQNQSVTLQGVLTTHHHWDHSGGNKKLVSLYESEGNAKLEVYGGDDRIEALTKKVEHGDQITLGSLNFECLFTPCHTSGHICYYLKTLDSNQQKPAVFTGDTLFIGGCGRFFEGTADEMHTALNEKLGKLPDETMVFCGHEYTVANLKFGLSVEPTNQTLTKKMAWAQDKRSSKIPTVPSTIGEEKEINPFMRVDLPDLQKKVNASSAVECMKILRAMKNEF